MIISLVPPDHAADVMNTVPHLVSMAAETSSGRYSETDLYQHVSEGRQMLWIAFDEKEPERVLAIVTSHIIDYPSRRVLSLQLSAGVRMPEWIDDMARIFESFARDQKCDGIEMVGRRGWGSFLDRHGWVPKHTVYEKFMEAHNG